MFSKRTMMIVGLLVVIAVNIIILSVSSRTREPAYGLGRLAIYFVSPFQKAVTHTVQFVEGVWEHYFFLVSVSRENEQLRSQLDVALESGHRCTEVDLTNQRLKGLLNFQKSISRQVLPAAVIGKDPSSWFKTIIIDKGLRDGVIKGLSVVVPAGIGPGDGGGRHLFKSPFDYRPEQRCRCPGAALTGAGPCHGRGRGAVHL